MPGMSETEPGRPRRAATVARAEERLDRRMTSLAWASVVVAMLCFLAMLLA